MNVRLNCVVIVEYTGFKIDNFRLQDIQNEHWTIIIIKIFKNKNILVDGISELNAKGSNDEKISDIIQDMGYPLGALKAPSLFNLMSQILVSLSHKIVQIGWRMQNKKQIIVNN